MAALPVCPRCRAPRILAPECPNCGVIYARAEARAAALANAPVPPPPAAEPLPPAPGSPADFAPASPAWDGDVEDPQLELRLRAAAIPVALLVMFLVVRSGFGHGLLRIFLSMWIHELGHAVTAWLCGYPAFPGPWLTPVGATRSPVMALLLAAGLGYLAYRSFKAGRRGWTVAASAVLALQLMGTLVLKHERAQALITFGGDGGCLVLGAALMATVYARPGSRLHQGALRWGFLVIGAAAFMDAFEQWWAARSDVDRIPFGANEGAGSSDPTVLVDTYGWSVTQLVGRYTGLGLACLVALGVVYAWGLRQARARLQA